MSLEELYTILNNAFTDKVTYRAWAIGNAPSLPFVCYYVDETDNFIADNKVFKKITSVTVELYTKDKDIASEELLENALENASIPWDKYEEYIESENCYLISYDITI